MRESVEWFAGEMEAVLRENDHKPGWGNCELMWLLRRLLVDESLELRSALFDYLKTDNDYDRGCDVIREAADIANFAMMIADNIRKALEERLR